MLKKSKAWVDMLRTGLAKVIVSTVLVATAGWANAAPTLFDYPINISPGFGEASGEAPGGAFLFLWSDRHKCANGSFCG